MPNQKILSKLFGLRPKGVRQMSLKKTLAIGLATGMVVLQSYHLSAYAADGPGWGPGHGMMWAGPTHNWFGWGMSAHFCGDDGKQNIKLFMALIDRTISPTEPKSQRKRR